MKKTIWIVLLLCMSTNFTMIGQKSIKSDILFTTDHFTFHNNKWMNLHHFFYEQASHGQKKHLKDDGVNFINTNDSLTVGQLDGNAREVFLSGVSFYKENVINQPLLIQSGRILKWLQQQPDKKIADTSYSSSFTNVLNTLEPIYSKYFWERHKTQNQLLLDRFKNTISANEEYVIKKLENLSGNHWSRVVRVDITAYGNWASAYSPASDNIVVSSMDPLMHSTLFVEFVFHESSHLLFDRSSLFRKSLFQISKETSIKYPRNLWHAAMFYLSGLATKEALGNSNIEHHLIMDKKKVFENYYKNEDFKNILKTYYNSEIDIKKCSAKLLELKIS